jgi:hypothetical protein
MPIMIASYRHPSQVLMEVIMHTTYADINDAARTSPRTAHNRGLGQIGDVAAPKGSSICPRRR